MPSNKLTCDGTHEQEPGIGGTKVTEAAGHYTPDFSLTIVEALKALERQFEADGDKIYQDVDSLVLVPSYGDFLSHRGTPSYHTFINGIFHYKPSILGYPHLWKPPDVHAGISVFARAYVADRNLSAWGSPQH